jgi:hypothetical protein
MRSITAWIAQGCLAVGLASTSNSLALAHSGHTVEVVSAHSPLHYMLQPEHAVGGLLLAAVTALGLWQLHAAHRRQRQRLARVKK